MKYKFHLKSIIILFIFLFNHFKLHAVQLSGVYFINPALAATTTNFHDFNSAITFLTNSGTRNDGGPTNSSPFGVSGNVFFQIASGTYNLTSAISIPAIVGTSMISMLTFDGGNTSSCLITGNITSSATVILNQCNYVRFRNITITNQSNIQCTGFAIIGNTSNNAGTGCALQNCIINLSNTFFPSQSCGINISSSPIFTSTQAINADSVLIDSNTIIGGYYGIYMRGNSSGSFNAGIKIRSNRIERPALVLTFSASILIFTLFCVTSISYFLTCKSSLGLAPEQLRAR